jgi:DNA-binding response OmpR family regulator
MKNQPVVLVVEDDPDINQLLCTILTKQGYEAVAAFSGSEGLMLINSKRIDLVLLDLMLPGLIGQKFLNEIRKTSRIPVIIISARDSQSDKIELLKAGADDYVTKPFDAQEVIARIEAQLRRYLDYGNADRQSGNLLTHKDIVLDLENHEVKVKGSPVLLTAREYAMLELLMRHPNKVFTKQNLFESIWGEEYYCDDNTINVHMSNLRNKLSKTEDYIQTLWGIGYKMSEAD